MANTVTRNAKKAPFISQLVSAQVTKNLLDGIEEWVECHEDSNKSIFFRQAIREKLARDGIKIKQ